MPIPRDAAEEKKRCCEFERFWGMIKAFHVDKDVLSRLDQQQTSGLRRFLCVEGKAFTAASLKTSSSKMMRFLSIPGPLTGGQWGWCGAVACRFAAGRNLHSLVFSLLMHTRDWWMNCVFLGGCTQSSGDKRERICCYDNHSSREKLLNCITEDLFARTDACGGSSGRTKTFSQLKRKFLNAASMGQTRFLCGDIIPVPLMISFPLPASEYMTRVTWRSNTSSCVPSAAAAQLGLTVFPCALATAAAARGICCSPASAAVVVGDRMARAFTTGGGLVVDVAPAAAPSAHVAQLSSVRFKVGDPRSSEESSCSSPHVTQSSRDNSMSAAAAVGDPMRNARGLQLFPYVARDVAESPQRKIHFSALLTAALRTPQQQQHVASFLFEEIRCRCALQLVSLQLLAELLQQADTEAATTTPPGSSYSTRSKSDNSSNTNSSNLSSICNSSTSNSSSSNSSNALGCQDELPALRPLEGWLGQAQEALLHQFGLLLLASNALKEAKKVRVDVAAGETPHHTSESSRGGAAPAPGETYSYPTGEEGSIPPFTSSATPSSNSSSHSQGSDSNTSSMAHNSGSTLWAGKMNFLSLVHALRSIHAHILPRVVAGSRASFNATLERQETQQQQQRRQQAWPQQEEQEQGVRTLEGGDKNERPLKKEESSLEKTEVKLERLLEDFLLRGVSIGMLLSHFELLYHQTLHHMQKAGAQRITATAGAAEQRHLCSRNPSLLSSKPRDRGQEQQQQQRSFCTGTTCNICDTGRSSSSKIRNIFSHPWMQSCLRMGSSNSSTTYEERYSGSLGRNTERSDGGRRHNADQISSSSCTARTAEGRTFFAKKKMTPSASWNADKVICCTQSNGLDADLVCGSAAAAPAVLRGIDQLENQRQPWLRSLIFQQRQQPEREVERGCWWRKNVEERQQQRWLICSVRGALQQQGRIQQRAYSSMVMQQRLQHEEEDHDCMASYPTVGMITCECSPSAEFRAAAEKVQTICCRDLGAAPPLQLFVLSDTSGEATSSDSSRRESECSAKGRRRASTSSGSRFNSSSTKSCSSGSVVTGAESAQLLDADRQDVSTGATATDAAAGATGAAVAATGGGDARATGRVSASGVSFPSDVIMFPAAVLQYVLVELLKNAMRATLHRWYLLKEQEDEEARLRRQRSYQPLIRLGQRYRKQATGKQQQNWREASSSGDEKAWEWQSSSRQREGQMSIDFKSSISERIGVECMIMRTKEGIWIRLSDRGVGMVADAKKAAFKCLRKRADLLADAAQRFFGGSTSSSTTSSSTTSSSSDGEMKRPDFFSYSDSDYRSNWSDVHHRNFSPRAGGATEDSRGHERSSSSSSTWTNRVDRSSVNRQRSSSSAEPKMSGFGVGLVLSRAYMQYFGGNMLMHSTPEDGTDVYLFLPLIEKTTENMPDHPALLQRTFETAFDSIQDEMSVVRHRSRDARPAAEAAKTTGTAKTRPPDAEAAARGGEVQPDGRTGRTHTDAAAGGRIDSREAEKEEVRRRLLRQGVPPILIRTNGKLEESSAQWKLVWHKPEWDASSRKSN